MTTNTASSTTVPALTTTFSPVPSCFSDIYMRNDTNEGTFTDNNSQIQTYNYIALGPTSTSDCLPSGFKSTSSQYFSPGICPNGYTIAKSCSATVAIDTLTETHATCCPSGYACNSATDWSWYSTMQCTLTNTLSSTITITTTDAEESVTSFLSAYNGAGINAYGVSIRFQSGDFSKTTSSASAATSTSSSPPAHSSKLGSGAIAGIVIGIVTAVALLGVLVFWIRNRKLGRTQSTGQTQDSLLGKYGWGQSAGGPGAVGAAAGAKQNSWYEPVQPVELDTARQEEAYEMPGLSRQRTERHELPVNEEHDDPFRDGDDVRADGWMRG